jgi:hypothetical protein
MKKQLLAICLAAIVCAPIYANHSSSSTDSSSEALANVGASAMGNAALFPLTTTFQKIPFLEFLPVEGEGIKVIGNTDFRLEKGRYYVSYSNTEIITGQGTGQNATFLDYALFLGGVQIAEFTDSGELGFDNIKLKSFSLIVTVPRTSHLTIQAQLDPQDAPGAAVSLGNRTLSIIKLSSKP